MLDVKIVWKTPSQFEAQLRQDNHLTVAEYFFDLKPGLIDAVLKIQQHKETIMNLVKTQIEFSGKSIKIDRLDTLIEIENKLKLNPVLILNGEGGTGKTAIVKELLSSNNSCFSYVFKANQFNVSTLHEFFRKWGDATLQDFINEHQERPCLAVIDSAESLSDIDDLSSFYEFLGALMKANWFVIFTTRSRYYSDLMCLLYKHFKCVPSTIDVPSLEVVELQRFSREYDFTLPSNRKLIDLIYTPYYLQTYLDYCQNYACDQDVKGFLDLLWKQKIMRSQFKKDGMHILRSDCMLRIVKNKADDGCFYIDSSLYDKKALELLSADGVLGYDDSVSCYFIAHDVIEELALRKLLDKEYKRKSSYEGFFKKIGCSLTIKRAFRTWLLDKIESEPEQVRSLIDATLSQSSLSPHWRAESLISILISTKASEFFPSIESKLKENDFELLYRMIFLLKTVCKEYDSTLINLFKKNYPSEDHLRFVFTQPKGQGWDYVINLVFKYRESLEKWGKIVPLLLDWTRKHKKGSTTCYAGKVALCKYDKLKNNRRYQNIPRDIEEQLVSVILYSAGEIKDELSDYFESVLDIQEHRKDKLAETLLTSITKSAEAVKALPEYVEKLAWHYWVAQPGDNERGHYYRTYSMETKFGLSRFCGHSYNPGSALQTPVYFMLRYHPKRAIDFIIKLVNQSVETYVKSERVEYVESIVLLIDGIEYKQYIDNLLWNMYRGISGGPELLQSIHMALEKCLLELAEKDDGKIIEAICKELIRSSISASITAVVVSVILAYPNKTFSIASLLFRIPQLFIYDKRRLSAEQFVISLYSIGYGHDSKDYFRDERLKTYDDDFRKQSLEHIAFNYQLIRYDEDTKFEERKNIVWEILDEHYANLPPEQDQNEFDKAWRRCLARMDLRKMEPRIESQDGDKMVISLNPAIDPKLKKHNENILAIMNHQNRFEALQMWAEGRFRIIKNIYMKYDQYEKNVERVVFETKEVVAEMKNDCDDSFCRFYKNLPAYSCAVLIRDFSGTLSQTDSDFCKDVIMSYAYEFSKNMRSYQIGDGAEPAISVLPIIMEKYPDLCNNIKAILLKTLLHESCFTDFIKRGIQDRLWGISPDDASSVLIAYAITKDGYEKYRKCKYEKSNFNHSYNSNYLSLDEFWNINAELISRFEKNELTFSEIDVEEFNHRTLVSTIELLPVKIDDDNLRVYLVSAIRTLAKRFYDDKKNDAYDRIYKLADKICQMVLFAERKDALLYITPFIEHFQFSANSYLIFYNLIRYEYIHPHYDNFWYIWDLFFDKISDLVSNTGRNPYVNETLKYYLFSCSYWEPGATEWHSIKEKERFFFEKVVSKMGHVPVVLYSIAKILNDVGSKFALEGVTWISSMITTNKYIELENYTIEYIESFIRRFIPMNRQKVKRDNMLKNQVISILDFLVEKGSDIGFLLREEIL